MAILALTTDVYRFDDLTTCYPAADWHYAIDVPAAVLASHTIPEISLIIAVIGDGGVWQPRELLPLQGAASVRPLLIAVPHGYRDMLGASGTAAASAQALPLSRPLVDSERSRWQMAIATALGRAERAAKDKKKRPAKDVQVQKVASS